MPETQELVLHEAAFHEATNSKCDIVCRGTVFNELISLKLSPFTVQAENLLTHDIYTEVPIMCLKTGINQYECMCTRVKEHFN